MGQSSRLRIAVMKSLNQMARRASVSFRTAAQWARSSGVSSSSVQQDSRTTEARAGTSFS